MNVELLRRDELLVELEVRGLSDPTKGVVTSELKNALAERLRAEREYSLSIPWDPHVAAAERPEQEVAILLQKLHAVQQYLLKEIRAGKTMAEMYPQVATRMIHVRGRIDRSQMCLTFNPRSTRLHIVMKMLGRMVTDLYKGVVAAGDVAERLSRVVIKIDQPSNEDDGSSYEEVTTGKEEEDEAKVEEEEVNKGEVVEAEQEEDTAENEESEGAETEKEKEVQENEQDNEEAEDNGEDEGSSKEIVEVDKICDEVVEEVGKADVKANQEDEEDVEKVDEDENEEKEEPVKDLSQEGLVEIGEVDQEEEEVKEHDKSEDHVLTDRIISSNTVCPLQNLDTDSLPQMEHLTSKPSSVNFPPTRENVVVLMESQMQITGDFSRRARNSCGMLRRDVSARVRFKGLKCARVIAQLREWIKWLVARAHRPVDRLLGVLDLRLQDEVLAKASRRVGPEDV